MMDYSWEIFDGRAVGRVLSEPRVSFRKNGIIALNTLAYGMIGRPASVLLAYDSSMRAVGIMPADPSDNRAVTVTVRQDARCTKPSAQLSARVFVKHHKLDNRRTSSVVPMMAGNALVIPIDDIPLEMPALDLTRQRSPRLKGS